jgi:hypothetical protein
LAERCRAKLGALSPNGSALAYQYVAETATDADGVNVGITRVKTIPNTSTGEISVYVTDADGDITPTQLSLVNSAIQENAVPLCVTATVLEAIQHELFYEITVHSKSPIPTAAQVLEVMVDYFATIPIGGVSLTLGDGVYLDGISGVIHDAYPQVQLVKFDSMLDEGVPVTPPDNVALDPEDVPVLTTTDSDITIITVT